MTTSDIINNRLINQQIAETKFTKPQQIVSWMGAMQAQEFAMVKWAIGLRLRGVTDGDVEKAFNDGAILRTHLLRPTWHFVAPEDILWLLALTAPRVNVANAYWYRKFELDNKVFKKTNELLVNMLEGGKHLTRDVLNAELERNKIIAKGLRLSYLFMQAELEGILCSGRREGKQFTYALLEERVRKVTTPDRQKALAELTNRYFASRGPATIQDFVYWSGLTSKEAKEGVALLNKNVMREVVDGNEYLFVPVKSKSKSIQTTFLMPDYDEYGMSYKNRSALSTTRKVVKKMEGNTDYKHWLVVNGVIEGTWEKSVKGKALQVETIPFTALNKSEKENVRDAEKRFRLFMNNSVDVE